MSSRSKLIGICGGSGSGKTSFVAALKAKITDLDACFISMDDYYLPREQQLADEQGVKNFDLVSSIRIDSLISDLDKLQAGESIVKQRYTFNNEEAEAETFVLKPAHIYIVEGLFVYAEKALRERFDLKLFIEASDELKLIRRIKRDRIERNYPIEDVLYRYEHHVMPSYRGHIAIYKNEADIVINNFRNFDVGLSVISSYLNSLN